MKTEKQSIVPKSFIVMMMVMLGIALLPIRYYGYYVLLKIVICGGCAFLAAIAYGDGRKYLVWFGGWIGCSLQSNHPISTRTRTLDGHQHFDNNCADCGNEINKTARSSAEQRFSGNSNCETRLRKIIR